MKKKNNNIFELSQWCYGKRPRLAVAARDVQLVCLRALQEVFTGMAPWEAQPCQHSWPLCVAFTAVMVLQLQGGWKPRNAGSLLEQGNHLGSQWGLGEFDLWSKSKYVFTTSMICIACTNYLVDLSLCTRQEWVIQLPKKRARKYVYHILFSYGHLELLLHTVGSKHRWNSSLCELKTAAIITATQNLGKFFARLRQKHLGCGRAGNSSSALVLKCQVVLMCLLCTCPQDCQQLDLSTAEASWSLAHSFVRSRDSLLYSLPWIIGRVRIKKCLEG